MLYSLRWWVAFSVQRTQEWPAQLVYAGSSATAARWELKTAADEMRVGDAGDAWVAGNSARGALSEERALGPVGHGAD